MKRPAVILAFCLGLFCSPLTLGQSSRKIGTVGAAAAQQSPAPLVLTGAIPLPEVKGRIDHFGFDAEGNRLFLSALGNNTVEVIGLSAQRVLEEIKVPVPQGVLFAPDVKKLFVGSDEGKLYIYDGEPLKLITTIDFGDDVDNLRYEAAESRVYVGFGEGKSGAIGIVDAKTNQRLPREYRMGGHPESFQLPDAASPIYVNVPDLHAVVKADRTTGETANWDLALRGNFPMALDETHKQLFVATRDPARLVIVNTASGEVTAQLPVVQDADDLYYDGERKRIYVSGGEGYISVFQLEAGDRYQLIAKVPSAVGARTSAYFGKGRKGFDRLYVAVPARADHGAEVLIYTVQ